MGNCVSNEPNYSGGAYNITSNGSSRGGYGSGYTETAYGITVDFSGNWAYNEYATSTKSSRFDSKFKKAGAKLNIDWRIIAAVAWNESRFDPNAKNAQSTAEGLFQFVDNTWPYGTSRSKTDPDAQIDALINLWRGYLDKFQKKGVYNINDKIALTIQSHAAGGIELKGGTRWQNYTRPISNGKPCYSEKTWSGLTKYLKLTIDTYRQFCGKR